MALSLLRAPAFRVEARFERSFYLRALGCPPPQGPCVHNFAAEAGVERDNPTPPLLCCGQENLVMGPLMLLCAHWPAPDDLPSTGTVLTTAHDCLSWSQGILDTRGVTLWTARTPAASDRAHFPCEHTLTARLTRLLRQVSLPEQGLSCLLYAFTTVARPPSVATHNTTNALCAKAGHSLTVLHEWLWEAESSSGGFCPAALDMAVQGLLGLGPGLTPSGDDVLAGILLALHGTGRRERCSTMARCVAQRSNATNAISVAHLTAAAQGQGAETLHNLLEYLLARPLHHNDTPVSCSPYSVAQGLAHTGHSSGWDAALGMVLALLPPRLYKRYAVGFS